MPGIWTQALEYIAGHPVVVRGTGAGVAIDGRKISKPSEPGRFAYANTNYLVLA
ncbi:hypothetical protein [Nonomuraea angiospora]|uniref:hypothetical protein n=1 Tax=Nonomuraea angiospora TaxID=46172 RepID=UPI0029B529EF|nr:hypothetical protein [Nonomuraea angiospora]MDX3109750.1 hypothetical protein [Nonomuraea angiospora]